MSRRFINFLLVYTFIISVSGYIYPQNNPESDTIVINSINVRCEAGETAAEIIDYKDAAGWAHSIHLTLLPDSPPVTDNKAFLLNQFQSVIPVSGYKKDILYKLYIDFFRFSEKNVPFNSKLKIFIRDIHGNKKMIGTVDSSAMSDKKIFEISIPFELSYPGKFDIILNEFSEKTGNWGIWDIIVSSKKMSEIEIIPVDSSVKMKEIEPKIFK